MATSALHDLNQRYVRLTDRSRSQWTFYQFLQGLFKHLRGSECPVEIDFNGSKTIDRVIVYTLQDNYPNPIEPTDTLTFAQYGVTDFTVQGWNGAAWVSLGSVSGNTLVKRAVTFSAFTTTRTPPRPSSSLRFSARPRSGARSA